MLLGKGGAKEMKDEGQRSSAEGLVRAFTGRKEAVMRKVRGEVCTRGRKLIDNGERGH